jgi:hypothetical protein
MDRINISWDQDITSNAEVESMINDAALALGVRVEFRAVNTGPRRETVSFSGQIEEADPKAVALIVAQKLNKRLLDANANRIKVSVDHTLVLSI